MKKITLTYERTNKEEKNVMNTDCDSSMEILGILRFWEKKVWHDIMTNAPKQEEPEVKENPILKQPIAFCSMSNRLKSALLNTQHSQSGVQFFTVEDILKAGKTHIRRLRGIGKLSLKELDQFLQDNNLQINP